MNIKPFVLLLVVNLFYGCSNNAEKNLNSKLDQYKKCFISNDYICQSAFVLPSLINEAGGVDGFVELMKSTMTNLNNQGMKLFPDKVEFGKRSKLVSHKDLFISVIPTKIPIEIKGDNGFIHGSIIAFSKDSGDTWFFIEGSDEGKTDIANSSPEIMQKINIPTPTLNLGNVVLIQKNGSWVKP